MSTADYGDQLVENTTIEIIDCIECEGPAELRTMKVIDVHPEIVINTLECKQCHIKDVKIFDHNESDFLPLRIECNFHAREDLKRELSLHKNASVLFRIGDFEYMYEGSSSAVLTVESVLLICIDDLQSQNIIVDGVDRVQIDDTVGVLEKAKSDGCFYMQIDDSVGASRVSLRDRTLFEMQDRPIEDFNDECVKHVFLEE